MIPIQIKGGELSFEEQQAYIRRAREKYPDRELCSMDITVDGDFVDLHYRFEPIPFERIRRITGYLVGTMDRWNDAKTAEESERVKHN